MKIVHSAGASAPTFDPRTKPHPAAAQFPPLAEETREVVPTACAAHHLNRAEQTLRIWSCSGGGLLQPVRIGNRLGWRTSDIRRLLAGEAAQ